MPAIFEVELETVKGSLQLGVLSHSAVEAAHTILGNIIATPGQQPDETLEGLKITVARGRQIGGRG